jgi:hypothetical protein
VRNLAQRLPRPVSLLRVALAVFVLAWIFGPYALRSAVPIWVAFLIALGLELHFFAGAVGRAPAPRPDRGPQPVDRERYGYAEELWIPDSDEGNEDETPTAEALEQGEGEAGTPVAAVRERARLWPSVRRFLVGLGVIGALALVVAVVESRTGWDALAGDTRAEAAARFSDEASTIAAKPVTIQCDEAGDYVGAVQHADGAAPVGGDVAYLTPQLCLDLYRLAFKGEVTSSQTARALAVLAHEAWHLRGVRDEGTTECYALQSGVELGQRLGLAEDTARQMMRQQLAENAGRRGASAEYLVPPECRDGGRLDLDPDGTRFP